jgi:hypothetical protein
VDRSAVQRVASENLGNLKRRLGLQGWEIGLGYSAEASHDGSLDRGECTRLIDYQSAHISLNTEAFEWPDQVVATLRHEMFHVVLAPFDLYTSAVENLDLDPDTAEVLERVKQHALERCVAGLERMWEGMREP